MLAIEETAPLLIEDLQENISFVKIKVKFSGNNTKKELLPFSLSWAMIFNSRNNTNCRCPLFTFYMCTSCQK